MGKTTFKPKFSDLVSKSRSVNNLSAARFFLFGARDVWFVIALPVFLQIQYGWSSTAVGVLMATWIMGYGGIQMLAPRITGIGSSDLPDGRTAVVWGSTLTLVTLLVLLMFWWLPDQQLSLVTGLLIFGVIFAINSAVHSYLIVSYAEMDGVTLDVGFYYMSNAGGRLLGTVLSGILFQVYGLAACLAIAIVFVALSTFISIRLPVGQQT